MVNNLIKDLMNSKNKEMQRYYLENKNFKNNNIKEYIDFNPMGRDSIRKHSRKLTEKKKYLNSNKFIYNILNDNKDNEFNKRKIIDDNQIKLINKNANTNNLNLVNKASIGINTNEYIIKNNENNIMSHENNILVNENKFNLNNAKNIENNINFNIKGAINNFNINKENENINENKKINNKNIDIKNYLYKNNSNNFEILGEAKKENINNLIDINNLLPTKVKSFKIKNNLQNEATNLIKENLENQNETINSIEEELQTDTFNSTKNNIQKNEIKSLKITIQKEKTTLSNTDRIISRNAKLKNFMISNLKNDNSNEKILLLNTERKTINSKEREQNLSLLKDSSYPKLSFTNNAQNKNSKILSESLSGQKNLFQKGYQGKDIIENKVKERPISKDDKINKGIITKNNDEYNSISYKPKNIRIDYNTNRNKEFNSISYKPRNIRIDYNTNRNKEYNKEIYFDKNIETKMNYIKEKDIIDKPLLNNHYIFEVLKGRNGLEKKILELEYFTKKKFDELVREIKYFIPIHFNSHIKDYTIVEIDNKNRNKK